MSSFKKIIAFTILLVVNSLFVYKYSERITDYAGIITIFMSFFYISLWVFKSKIEIKNKQYILFITLSIFVLFGLSFLIFNRIPISSLNVDRWSVITSFWDSFQNSEWVYSAKSYAGNPPGPMPFYFILSLPFLMVGELGIITTIGILIFFVYASFTNTSFNNKLWSFIFLLSSSFNLWELATRSNIFFNATLVLGLLIWFQKLKKDIGLNLYLHAIVVGLLLSTRSVFIIPYIVLFFYSLLSKSINYRIVIFYFLVSGSVFILTFLPFVLNHFDDFLKVNPFIIQSTFLVPFYFTVFFIILAFVSSFLCRNSNDVYFYSGLTLFISIAIYFVYQIAVFGFTKAYLGSVADISYFILCTPFLIYYLVAGKVDDLTKENQLIDKVQKGE